MRDYDPMLGRYLQADPLGLVDGASVYGYALQNPGRYTDPRGEAVQAAPIIWAALQYCGKKIVQSIARGGMSQAATAGQGAAIAGGIAAATAGTEACGCDEDDEPKEDKCDKQFAFHLDICSISSTTTRGALCRSRAMQIYAQCLAQDFDPNPYFPYPQ